MSSEFIGQTELVALTKEEQVLGVFFYFVPMNPSLTSFSLSVAAPTMHHSSQRMLAFANVKSSRTDSSRNIWSLPSSSDIMDDITYTSTSKGCQRRQRWYGWNGHCRQIEKQHQNRVALFSSEYDEDLPYFEEYEEAEDDLALSKATNLSKLDTLEELLMDLENNLENLLDDDDEELDEEDFDENDNDDVEALLSLLGEDYKDDGDDDDNDDDDDLDQALDNSVSWVEDLEQALLQGVVPVSAGVGSDCLPGDWGFDPLHLADKDYILQAQFYLLQSIPGAVKEDPPRTRPSALILRDYREAEIRHGRLAMLAALLWPLQEMLDKLLLDVDQFGPLVYGPVTLPYFPLLMTLIMMLLGYLDIYAKAIQEEDDIGDAFLPGDCFWDPLKILEGAPASMKRNMQERELFNGRVAMVAFGAYTFEEVTTHLPLISVKGNELLFLPAYQIPYIQEYLDDQFSFYSHY